MKAPDRKGLTYQWAIEFDLAGAQSYELLNLSEYELCSGMNGGRSLIPTGTDTAPPVQVTIATAISRYHQEPVDHVGLAVDAAPLL